MTNAGTAEVALAREDSYRTVNDASTLTWFQPGVNISLTGPTLDRQQERTRQPDDPRPQSSRPGQISGSLTIEFSLTGQRSSTGGEWEQALFHDGGSDAASDTSLPSQGGVVPSFRVYVASSLTDGTQSERILTGAVVTEAEVNWSEGEDVTVSLTMEYATEDDSASAPDTIEQPSASDVYAFHGADIDVGGTFQANLNTATLSVANLARLRYGQEQAATAAVVGALEPSFTTDAVFTEVDQLSLAQTGTGDGELTDSTTANLSFNNDNGDTFSYNLEGLSPTSHEWSSVVEPDGDLTENVEYHVTTVSQ